MSEAPESSTNFVVTLLSMESLFLVKKLKLSFTSVVSLIKLQDSKIELLSQVISFL